MAEQQNHSPVYKGHKIGILIATHDLDFIQAHLAVALFQETNFLYGHLKQQRKHEPKLVAQNHQGNMETVMMG